MISATKHSKCLHYFNGKDGKIVPQLQRTKQYAVKTIRHHGKHSPVLGTDCCFFISALNSSFVLNKHKNETCLQGCWITFSILSSEQIAEAHSALWVKCEMVTLYQSRTIPASSVLRLSFQTIMG